MLQTINNILHTMRVTLFWRSMGRIAESSKGCTASTFIPDSAYSETVIHHSAVFTRYFLNEPRLGDHFKLLCSKIPDGHLFLITAEPATRSALFNQDPSGLEACMRYRHRCLAQALLAPRVTKDNLLIFPELSGLNFAENTELMETLHTLVFEPSEREFSKNSNLETVVHQLKTFHPDHAKCVTDIVATIPMLRGTANRYGFSLLEDKKSERKHEVISEDTEHKKSFK